MGTQIERYFELVDDEYGLIGKIKLAQLTKVSSTLAAATPDSPENLKRFEEAMATIRTLNLSKSLPHRKQ